MKDNMEQAFSSGEQVVKKSTDEKIEELESNYSEIVEIFKQEETEASKEEIAKRLRDAAEAMEDPEVNEKIKGMALKEKYDRLVMEYERETEKTEELRKRVSGWLENIEKEFNQLKYEVENGKTKVEIKFHGDDNWLNLLAHIFESNKSLKEDFHDLEKYLEESGLPNYKLGSVLKKETDKKDRFGEALQTYLRFETI